MLLTISSCFLFFEANCRDLKWLSFSDSLPCGMCVYTFQRRCFNFLIPLKFKCEATDIQCTAVRNIHKWPNTSPGVLARAALTSVLLEQQSRSENMKLPPVNRGRNCRPTKHNQEITICHVPTEFHKSRPLPRQGQSKPQETGRSNQNKVAHIALFLHLCVIFSQQFLRLDPCLCYREENAALLCYFLHIVCLYIWCRVGWGNNVMLRHVVFFQVRHE